MSYWEDYAPYVSVSEQTKRAEKKLKQLRKKKTCNYDPVELAGTRLGVTWWGKSWNENLESYADYDSRLGRGRRYVRCKAILDLRIEKGMINALVLGSDSSPYKVEISIKALSKKRWKEIVTISRGQIDTLDSFLTGKLHKDLSKIFSQKGSGIFPTPRQIQFTCSCPDWADMCKHVAATLYGVGSRLDEDPLLLFSLRDICIDSLITDTVKDQTKNLLKKSEQKISNRIDDAKISEIFGIELE